MRMAICLLFFFFLFACPAISSTVPHLQLDIPIEKGHTKDIPPKSISSLKIRDIEKIAGRKFTLKEKIAFLVLKKKLKREEDTSSRQGKTAFIFGVAAAALLILGLFIPYIILGSLIASIVAIVMGSSALKKNPNDRKAHLAKLLGWITLGLFALLLILAAIVLSSFEW